MAEKSNVSVQRSKDPRVIGYRHRLNWYQVPPPYEITLEEFEVFALDRLHVLKSIETAHVRNLKKDEDLRHYLKDVIKKYLPLSFNSMRDMAVEEIKTKLFNERKKDHVSHFLLRLAYCRTEDLRNWFVKMETELFRLRLTEETAEQRDRFLKQIDLSISPVQLKMLPTDSREKDAALLLIRELSIMTGLPESEVQKQSFFKVEFEKVTDLVMKRMVVVKDGFAYVPSSLQTTLIVNEFRDRLVEAMDMTARAIPRMDEDDRLTPILNSLGQQHVNTRMGSYMNQEGDTIQHTEVDSLADPHFPLCMRTLHQHLRQESHLKHNARLQYGLFLKGIGLPMEEALTFWRKAFHKMTDDQFQKGGYAYNIRHNYGMEGKRTNYAPYNCVKIITTNHPGAGENHGCPFRHHSQDNLRTLLTSTLMKSNNGQRSVTNNVNELLKMVSDGHYQVACTRLYEFTHTNEKGEKEAIDMIDHPNLWFELSYKGSSKKGHKVRKQDPSKGPIVHEVLYTPSSQPGSHDISMVEDDFDDTMTPEFMDQIDQLIQSTQQDA